MELFTARQVPSKEGVTFSWFLNDEEEIESGLTLSEIFLKIRYELDKLIDMEYITKERAYELSTDWLAYDELIEGLLYQ